MDKIKIRDEIIKLFFSAQQKRLNIAAEEYGFKTTRDLIEASVINSVKFAFCEANGDFDNPTKASLNKVLTIMKKKFYMQDEEILPNEKIVYLKKMISKL